MRPLALLLIAALALAGCDRPGAKPEMTLKQETVRLKAADGVGVYGTYLEPANPRALILLFHQARSGQNEYTTIAPRLAQQGFASLAIDQRSGGDLYGGNWTVKEIGHNGDYLDARKDLEAALAWGKQKKLPIILWGSSYSASLVFMVAADHPGEIAALLAFSPAEYFKDKVKVGDSAAKVTIPIFVTSSQDQPEIDAAKALLDAAPAKLKRQYIPYRGGIHGASILVAERNPDGAQSAWDAVIAFLDEAKPR